MAAAQRMEGYRGDEAAVSELDRDSGRKKDIWPDENQDSWLQDTAADPVWNSVQDVLSHLEPVLKTRRRSTSRQTERMNIRQASLSAFSEGRLGDPVVAGSVSLLKYLRSVEGSGDAQDDEPTLLTISESPLCSLSEIKDQSTEQELSDLALEPRLAVLPNAPKTKPFIRPHFVRQEE